MAKYTNKKEGEQDIIFDDVNKPQIYIGTKIAKQPYKYDENNNIIHNDLVINAIDIDWNNAQIDDKTIKTSADLLRYISTKSPNIESLDVDKLNWGESKLNELDVSINSTQELLNIIDRIGSNGGGISPDISNSIISQILLSIRALQSEVAKLRNSFRFGINSYTDENFGMSQTVNELNDINEEEPLWATDESELSFIEGLDLSQQSYQYITPIDNFEILPNDKLSYNGEITFTIPEAQDGKNILEVLTDPKQYIYLTCTNKDVDINLKNESGEILTINVKDIIQYNYVPEKYNILIIVSKKIEHKKINNDVEFIGNNFIWLSISEWGTGMDLFNGYISEDGTYDIQTSETPIYNENIYNISSIDFHTNSIDYIYKLDVYSKYQDVSNVVEASTPTDVEDYKYRTAAITIRSMKTLESIQNHINELQNNELIFCESDKKLYIYTNGNLINIGSGGNNTEPTPDDIMANYEILKALEEQGLINIVFIDDNINEDQLKYDDANIKSYNLSDKFKIESVSLNDIDMIHFINGETGKKFDVSMNPYGQFDIKEKHQSIIKEKNGDNIVYRTIGSMKEYLQKSGTNDSWIDDLPEDYHSDRSFVSLIKGKKLGLKFTGDMGLNGDHIEIGAIYAPLKTDTIHGCTHGYIELFNASDEDFYLDGCYLHYSYAENTSETQKNNIIYHKLALDGYIPAGGTYLIRCKQYAKADDPNVFINVATYDKEWYIGINELLDLSISSTGGLSLALTYDDKLRDGTLIDQATEFMKVVPSDTSNGYILSGGDTPLVLISTLIDSKCIGNDWGNTTHWVPKDGDTYKARVFSRTSNSIYKVTFELDPAKQAFQSMTTKDSSRRRWANSANDQQFVSLDREFIEFPKTELVKSISDYTPKASFEYKNVITDKSKLDKNNPNAIVCSYGINPYTTRCFNWVSSGLFNEAVVIIDQNNVEHIYQSYTTISEDISQATTEIHRKEFPVNINNAIYARIYNKFPGNNEPYTSHKCIIELPETTNEPITYQYYICRLDSNGKIDKGYKSNIRTFTLYPRTYQPRVYQITDQQGFHWIEYQVWAASAKMVNEKILADQAKENIMPIIINTGDCVQSGARVNEWLDYFNAGEYLFSHFEQNNIVGNNDLCDTDINKLGTGDDTGKSNGYFFHLFNCYEVSVDEYVPIVNNKYIPSLYYVDLDYINNEDIHKYIRILFINSEITTINCKDWFGLVSNNYPVNIYTGFTISTEQTYVANELNFKPIYEILYQWTNDNEKTYLPVCHEMPFTVITNACLSWYDSNQIQRFRSLSDAATAKLIGSHTNQIDASENGKGMHWMSRLFEYRGITLCLGGHKHTYACTYPVRENYLYTENNEKKWSYKDGPMNMPESLQDDNAIWTLTCSIISDDANIQGEKTINLSKFPIVKRQQKHKNADTNTKIGHINYLEYEMIINISPDSNSNDVRFYPFVDETNINNNYTYVIYNMSQATGYKLTSNKELPSQYQKFSMIIPKTIGTPTTGKPGKFSDTASGDQQSPMFGITNILGDNKYDVQVVRISNISSANNKMTFKQGKIGKKESVLEYLCMTCKDADTYNFGLWCKYNKSENNKDIFVQTDVAASKTKLNYIHPDIQTDTTFFVDDNTNSILYPSLITKDNIYLFKTYDMFNIESGDII